MEDRTVVRAIDESPDARDGILLVTHKSTNNAKPREKPPGARPPPAAFLYVDARWETMRILGARDTT